MAGAIFGPIAGLAGLAANSRSAGQREAQLEALNQLKMSGMLEENAANAFTLKQTQAQDAARQKILNDPKTPQSVKDALALGATPTDALKMQTQMLTSKVEAVLLQMPDKASRQAFWSTAAEANPSLVMTPTIAKLLGIGGTDDDYNAARTALAKSRTTQIDLLNKMMQDPAMKALVLKALGGGALGGPDDLGGGATGAPDDLEEIK